MAIYHLNVKTGSKAKGQSGKAKSDYISREGRYSKDQKELVHVESGNMPTWAEDSPGKYWETADTYERANGIIFREVEFALPVELDQPGQIELSRKFAQELTQTKKGTLPYTLALHKGKGKNPHCHLVMSERINDGHARTPETWFRRAANKGKDPATGGAKKAVIGERRKKWLEQARESWAKLANKALELVGNSARIDHRTLVKQGVEREPGIHLGPHVVEMEKKGIKTDRAEKYAEIVALNVGLEDLYGRNGTDHTSEREQDSGSAGRTDRATSAEFGNVSRRQQGSHAGDQPADDNSSRELEQSAGRGSGKYQNGNNPLGATGRKTKKNEQADDVHTGIHWSDSRSRILHLSDGAGHMKNDRTARAVRRQLQVMGCQSYDIGIRDAKSGKMMHRTWSAVEVQKNVSWLKRMNARGNDIYVRPAEAERHGLILVDDIDGITLDEMAEKGHKSFLSVETSPGNRQAWVKVGKDVSGAIRAFVARELAAEYGADPNSADSRHYGRLAGFTNQKPEHQGKYGRQPYCLVKSSSLKDQFCSEGAMIVNEARKKFLKQERIVKIEKQKPVARYSRDYWAMYRVEMKGLQNYFGEEIDWSRADYMAVKKILKAGCKKETAMVILREQSPNLVDRKAGHEQDYATRTVQKASFELKKEAAKVRIEKESQKQDRGWSMGR